MSWLTQNSKMKKSSKGKARVLNWTLPAYRSESGAITCPNAGVCGKTAGCYAQQGAYNWPLARAKHNANFDLSKLPSFSDHIIDEVKRKRDVTHIRIHDAGDFYSMAYAKKWIKVMEALSSIQFYAYTKEVALWKTLAKQGKVPANFTVIFSFGGKQDHLIDTRKDRHSKVFSSAIPKGYVNASNNDLLAIGDNINVGLIYHGAKGKDWGEESGPIQKRA